jgi:hypothetical protein
MKTMKTTMIAFAMLVLANFAHGSGNVRLNVVPEESEKAYVEISNTVLTQFEIDVRDEFGEVVFYKKTMEPAAVYKKKYDFSALEDGIYTLSVKSERELNQTRFSIKYGEIEILGERKVVEPHFTMDGNTWKMSYLNFPLEKMDLYVYDGNRLLYEKRIDPVFAVHEGLDLSELYPGNYQVVFATQSDSFEHEVTVK